MTARRVWPYALLLAVLALLAPVFWSLPLALGDYPNMWFAGHLIATGGSPYDQAAWAAAHAAYGTSDSYTFLKLVWAYPPWTAYLLAPFGALPIESGVIALRLAYLAVGAGAIVALARSFTWRSRTAFALALSLPVVSVGFVNSVRGGEFIPLLLGGIVLIGVALRGGPTVALVAGSLLVATKPNVFALYGPLVVATLAAKRQWARIAIVVAALAGAALISIARDPGSLSALAVGFAERAAGGYVGPRLSTWLLAGPISAAVIVSVTVAACAWAYRRSLAEMRVEVAAAGALILSLTVAPYWLPYDQLILVPAAIVALAIADRDASTTRGPLLASVVLLWGVVAWVAFFLDIGRGTLGATAVVPPLLALLLAFFSERLRVAEAAATRTGPAPQPT